MFFSDRNELAERYELWLKKNPDVKDCALSVITYLDGIGLLRDANISNLEENNNG